MPPQDQTRFLTHAEAADLIGLARPSFSAKRAQLRQLGFPEPLAWNGRLFLRAAVEEWLASRPEGPVDPVATRGGDVVQLRPAARAAAARRLAARAEGRGAS